LVEEVLYGQNIRIFIYENILTILKKYDTIQAKFSYSLGSSTSGAERRAQALDPSNLIWVIPA